jgi:hypothetical protein
MDQNNIESLWNKSMLEKKINIRAAEYKFSDKKKFYKWFNNDKWKFIKWTENKELIILSQKTDFIESDIIERKDKIFNSFMQYLGFCWLIDCEQNSIIDNPLNYDGVIYEKNVEATQNKYKEKSLFSGWWNDNNTKKKTPKPNFKFSMIWLKWWEELEFTENKSIKVKVVPVDAPWNKKENLVEYKWEKYSLSKFVKEFHPHRNDSWAYQWPDYFLYKWKKLTELRKEIENLNK